MRWTAPGSHDAGGRISCPQCGANNFPEQARCWQCQTPLYPVASAPRQVLHTSQHPAPQTDAGRGRPGLRGLVLVLAALLTFLVVFLAAGGLRRESEGVAPFRAPAASAPSVAIPEEPTTPTPSAGAQVDDPLVEQARRAIERARGDIGPPPANAATDEHGRLHLRAGGTLSREEWEAARRKVQESPLLRDPPAPPPY